ncbi:MAG: tyrosine-type recombinase/integrase [Actinomycetaceae bacterium]|nr:tyrosine-type recombinase/integrase [Actinomycetaceae bacterium]
MSWKERHQQAASVVLVLARTGLRWSEARALLVGDVELGEHPSVMVTKARPEGHTVSTTKSGKSRRVPLTADVAEVLRGFAEGKCPDDLLMPPMHRSRLTQQLAWAETSGERTLHDLRHTAICNWLRAGVDVATVREWAGHADLVMTSRYTHYLGLAHDALSIDKVNQLVSGINEAVGTSQVHTASNF